MKNSFLLVLVLFAALLGCAGNPQQSEKDSPAIQRISEAELVKMMPNTAVTLSLDEIIKLSKEGIAPEQIIEKISTANAHYDLSPSQILALSKEGVESKVLDYIHDSHERAFKNNVADEINKREKAKRNAENQLENERSQRYQYYGDPFFNPYFGTPYWRRQFYWGPSFYYHRHR